MSDFYSGQFDHKSDLTFDYDYPKVGNFYNFWILISSALSNTFSTLCIQLMLISTLSIWSCWLSFWSLNPNQVKTLIFYIIRVDLDESEFEAALIELWSAEKGE